MRSPSQEKPFIHELQGAPARRTGYKFGWIWSPLNHGASVPACACAACTDSRHVCPYAREDASSSPEMTSLWSQGFFKGGGACSEKPLQQGCDALPFFRFHPFSSPIRRGGMVQSFFAPLHSSPPPLSLLTSLVFLILHVFRCISAAMEAGHASAGGVRTAALSIARGKTCVVLASAILTGLGEEGQWTSASSFLLSTSFAL